MRDSFFVAGDEADGAFEIVTEFDADAGVHPSSPGARFRESFDGVDSIMVETLEVERRENGGVLEVSTEGEEGSVTAVFGHILEGGEASGG